MAVKAEPEGRGGSLAMHALTVGQVLAIGGPRNTFPPRRTARPCCSVEASG